MANERMTRGDKRAEAKEAWRQWTGPRTQSFVDFWRARNDDEHKERTANQQKRSMKRRKVNV